MHYDNIFYTILQMVSIILDVLVVYALYRIRAFRNELFWFGVALAVGLISSVIFRLISFAGPSQIYSGFLLLLQLVKCTLCFLAYRTSKFKKPYILMAFGLFVGLSSNLLNMDRFLLNSDVSVVFMYLTSFLVPSGFIWASYLESPWSIKSLLVVLGPSLIAALPIAVLTDSIQLRPEPALFVWFFSLPFLFGLCIYAFVQRKRGNPEFTKLHVWASFAITIAVVLEGLLFFLILVLAGAGSPRGRPFRSWRGKEVLPGLILRRLRSNSDSTSQAKESVHSCSNEEELGFLREKILETIKGEHASIATFSRLNLELLAAGAPHKLIEKSSQAVIDEIRHTRIFSALHKHIFLEEVTVKPCKDFLDIGQFSARFQTLSERIYQIGKAAFTDGMCNEGYHAAYLETLVEHCKSDRVGRLLLRVAQDERKHFELAKSIVGWSAANTVGFWRRLSSEVEELKAYQPQSSDLHFLVNKNRFDLFFDDIQQKVLQLNAALSMPLDQDGTLVHEFAYSELGFGGASFSRL
jgi:hypothetical protein